VDEDRITMVLSQAVYELAKDVLASLDRIEKKLEFLEDHLLAVADELFEVGERLSELS
jgi:hypothetical protein